MHIRLLLALPLLAATGCAQFDPYRREGTWRPSAANEQNLATMAVAPAERVRGTGAAGAMGFTAAGAIERLQADRVKPLPDTGVARIITVPGGGSN
ncbi:hypothetical protein E2C06_26555 [Dankookia rubra]|uniref:DUF3035 domain-containing protein n=1 Tax=Dankookia rubra TaxID=1442381 RepID=A0A4R5QAM9_9PROT|nr:hypothetical protein [Dankookia rubra]TDH59608.1 hypothetical protein E2C06_26555 [Dankookia rubra]